MLVKATNMSAKLKVGIKELHRIAAPGEEFEVSDLRFQVLSGKNKYKAVFVLPVENIKEEPKEEPVVQEEPIVEEVIEEVIEEVPIIEAVEESVEEQPKKGRGRKKADASE